MATIMGDRERVEQLRRRLSKWNPDEICQIHSSENCVEYDKQGNLIRLHLCRLELKKIPSEIWQFSALQFLNLSCNLLSSLPTELNNFFALKGLYLNSNQLSALLKEMSNLSSLQFLNLSDNQLSSLPSELGNLSSLQYLDLSYNQLSFLPSELGNLSSLQLLDLRNNQLSSLPPELGDLSSLRLLDVSDNLLSFLPPELGNLSSLEILSLDNNPLQIPPSHIIGQEIPAILAYLRRAALDTYLISQSLSPHAQAGQTIRVFYLYAQADIGFREELEKHVSGLRLQRLIVDQHEGKIPGGEDREQMVRSYLDRAEIVLLLVSPDFMASDFMASEDMEVQWVMQRHARGEIRVVPILLRSVDYTGAPFASLAHFPSTGEPITRWLNRDDAFLNIVQGLRTVLQEILTRRFEGIQKNLEGLHGQIDALRDPYAEIEGSLKRLSEEEEGLGRQCHTVEEEIVALQSRLQGLRQQVTDLFGERQRIEEERQEMQQEALELRNEEKILEQEAQALNEQIEKVKQQ